MAQQFTPSLSAYVCYKDPAALIQQLCEALGSEKITE